MNIVRLQSADTALFEQAIALYAISFPYHEQRESASQRGIMAHDAYHFGLIHEGGAFAGLILYWETDAFLYVEHFCMLPECRGRGLGSQALALLTQAGKTVILEIDPPVDDPAKRRKRFYEKAGFLENPYPHIHPPYHVGFKGHDLVVMSLPRTISQEEYNAFARYLSDVVMR